MLVDNFIDGLIILRKVGIESISPDFGFYVFIGENILSVDDIKKLTQMGWKYDLGSDYSFPYEPAWYLDIKDIGE